MADERTLKTVSPSMFRNRPILFTTYLLLILAYGLGLLLLFVWWLMSKCTVLTVTDRRTILRKGLLSKATNEVRHTDVRNIQISQSFLQRIFGVGTMGISSAGQSGLEIEVAGISKPYAVKALIDKQR